MFGLLRKKKMMCQEMVELVTDYFEDRLAPKTRKRFEAHVAMCDECPKYIEQLRHTISVTGQLSAEEIAPEVMDDLLAAFRDWTPDEPA